MSSTVTDFPKAISSTNKISAATKVHSWAMSDIAYDQIELEKVKSDEVLFFVLASASLIESGSDMYTSVLVDYFGDSDVANWLTGQWEHEELQHGESLRKYVESVWPEFDWAATYQSFFDEYSGYCTVNQFEPTPTLELVARCVVETGTAALYRALEDYTDEPILKLLAGNIRRDEVRHYKNFNRFFNQYNREAGHGRWPIFKALARRLAELRNEDSDCALRHIFEHRYPGVGTDTDQFKRISRAARSLVLKNITPDMMVKMFLQPLQLPGYVRNTVEKPCSQMMRFFMAS
ncbi:MAG: ferritin-like protein [Verrucomicrobiaceae bacterium]|nr:ferritin-like protein [Verrucomicrobiaceae bacterium]